MSTQITKLPTAYAPSGFSSALAASINGNAAGGGAQTSSAVSLALAKSMLVSFSTTAYAGFMVEVSADAGASWKVLESFNKNAGLPPDVRMYTPNEAVQLRFTAYSGAGLTPTVAVAYLTL